MGFDDILVMDGVLQVAVSECLEDLRGVLVMKYFLLLQLRDRKLLVIVSNGYVGCLLGWNTIIVEPLSDLRMPVAKKKQNAKGWKAGNNEETIFGGIEPNRIYASDSAFPFHFWTFVFKLKTVINRPGVHCWIKQKLHLLYKFALAFIYSYK